MQLDITSILSVQGNSLPVSGKILLDSVIFCGTEFGFGEEAEISGTIVNNSGVFVLNADVKGKVTVNCARCGKPTEAEFSFELNEKLIKQGSPCTDEEATLFEGSVIDVKELVLNGFLMNTPTRYLCKEDCKGICPICGTNRNEKECGCEEQVTDPRLDILNNIKF